MTETQHRVSIRVTEDDEADDDARARAVSLRVVDEGPGEDMKEEPRAAGTKKKHDIRFSVVSDADAFAALTASPAAAPAAPEAATAAPVPAAAPARQSRSRWLVVAAACIGAYFREFRSPPPHVAKRGLAWSPRLASKLDIVSARPTFAKWKRDGSLYLEADVKMRMYNPAPMPLRVKSMNMTALMRAVGSDELYAAGYKSAMNFKVPPMSSAVVAAKLTLHDLRLSMLAAAVVDAASELVCANFPAACGDPDAKARRPVLDSHLEGKLRLWPLGGVDVKCVMTAPLDVLGLPLPVVNTCQARLL